MILLRKLGCLTILVALGLAADPKAQAQLDLTTKGRLEAKDPPSAKTQILYLGYQDIGWVAVTILVAIPSQIRYRGMSPTDTSSLNRQQDLWVLDRWGAGTYNPTADVASELAILPLLALPMGVTLWDSYQGRQAWGAAANEAVVYAEAMFLSSSVNLFVRSFQLRSRPLVYGREASAEKRLAGEASGSFYSGHANAAFLSAVYFSYTWSLRNPDSQNQILTWTGSLVAASLVAGLRMAAGKHYLSDVMVGAASGSFFGWIFPYLHKAPAARNLQVGMRLNDTGIEPVVTWKF